MPGEELVPVTATLINVGRSERGGWAAAQLALLGVPWPPPPGWKAAAVGRLLLRADADRFVALRVGVRPPESPGLFSSLGSPDTAPGTSNSGDDLPS